MKSLHFLISFLGIFVDRNHYSGKTFLIVTEGKALTKQDTSWGQGSGAGCAEGPKASIDYFLVCPRTGSAATDALDDIKSSLLASLKDPIFPTLALTKEIQKSTPEQQPHIHHKAG